MWAEEDRDRHHEGVLDRVLAQVAERAEDIDIERAEAAKRRAEERLAQPMPATDFDRARAAMMKSLIRLQVATRRRSRG